MLSVNVLLVSKGSPHRPAFPLVPEYITIHDTDNTTKGAGALNHAKYLQSNHEGVSGWHYCVDDKIITQSIPDNENVWHCGDGSNGIGNRKSLAIEICVNSDSNYLVALNNTIDLVVSLMKKYNIDINHIKTHYDWSGKNCPRKLRSGDPINWQTFIDRINTEYQKPDNLVVYSVQVGAYSIKNNAEQQAEKLKELGFDTYIIEKEIEK